MLSPEQKQKQREYARAWYLRNSEKVRASVKFYKEQKANDPEFLERRRESQRCRDERKRRQRGQVTRIFYPEKSGKQERLKATQKAWRDRNRLEIRAYKKEQRKRHGPAQRIRILLAHRVNLALKNKGTRSAKTLKLLGCDIQWLMAWLEVHFQSGMTFENYGPIWHIDHIRPCASFDLTDAVQQKLCFHWTNLQPLWAAENFSKNDKWEEIAA